MFWCPDAEFFYHECGSVPELIEETSLELISPGKIPSSVSFFLCGNPDRPLNNHKNKLIIINLNYYGWRGSNAKMFTILKRVFRFERNLF